MKRFHNDHILDIRTNYKSTETFQYTYFTSVMPQALEKVYKGTQTPQNIIYFYGQHRKFQIGIFKLGYLVNLVNDALAQIQFKERESTLKNQNKGRKKILPFVTQYNPAIPNLKKILMSKWHHIENQPLLRKTY